MIEVQSLSKKFGSQWALKKTSWSVSDKRSLGLLGPNGAGKSTTMKIITGLLCSSEGRVLIDGEDILTNPVAAKQKIGYLPETPPLYEDLRVVDFLEFVCGLKSVAKVQRKSDIEKAIETMQLGEVAYKPIRVLSKGFRQRVGIAQALIGNPSLLVLDEPSVGLDPHQVYELRNIIKGLKKDHVVILSSHMLSEVQQVCDDVVILDKGEIKAQGPLKDLLSRDESARILQIELSAAPDSLVTSLRSLPAVNQVEVHNSSIRLFLKKDTSPSLNTYLDTIMRENVDVLSVSQKQQQLEDVFIEVTQ